MGAVRAVLLRERHQKYICHSSPSTMSLESDEDQHPNLTSNVSSSDCPEYQDEDYELLDRMEQYLGVYFSTFLAAFGIIANIAAILIFSKKSFKSNFNNLLVALAVADLLFLVLSVIDSVAKCLHPLRAHWLAGWIIELHVHLYPYFLWPLHNILYSAGIFMTISISIERYLAIYSPLIYRNRSSSWNLIFHILPVMAVSLVINIPKFLESKIVYDPNSTLTDIDITDLRLSEHYVFYYQNLTRLVLLGLVPLILLTFLNVRVYSAIQERKTNIKEKTYSVILLIIVSIFILCNVPRVVFNVYENSVFHNRNCEPPLWSHYFYILSNRLLPILNATVNFFIYFFTAKKFRKALFNTLLCKKEPLPGVVSKTSFRTGETTKVNSTFQNEETRKLKAFIRMTDIVSKSNE